MVIYRLGTSIEEIDESELDSCHSSVIITDASQGIRCLKLAGIDYRQDIRLSNIEFCMLEIQQEYLLGFLLIPKKFPIKSSHYHIMLFVNKHHIVIVDDEGYSNHILTYIMRYRTEQGITKEQFLYNYMSYIISKDMYYLNRLEHQLIQLEEQTLISGTSTFCSQLMDIRRELLLMNGYYDQLSNLSHEFGENENHILAETNTFHFRLLSNKLIRLIHKTNHLLSYIQVIRDTIQTNAEAEQSKNMEFLTVISTIFFPLTLITGWYGMNFQNMPELAHGYPGVIALSLVVIWICIIIFRKKKIL